MPHQSASHAPAPDRNVPHHHHHAHHGAAGRAGWAFAVGILLNAGFVAVETGFGLITNSLALLADAGHNLTDVLSLILAWAAAALARRRPSHRRTYGLKKSTVIASLANGVLLMLVSGGLAWEAVRRLGATPQVATTQVMIVAGIGVVINGITALLFMADRKHDLNVKGAFLHMLADAAVSLGVVVAALVMSRTGWLWIDPVVSLVIVLVIALGTWGLLRDSLDLALDAVPAAINPRDVAGYLESLPGVTAVHDLHIWAMSTTENALTAHLVRPSAHIDDAWLAAVTDELRVRFGIPHATLQVEHGSGPDPCRLASADVV